MRFSPALLVVLLLAATPRAAEAQQSYAAAMPAERAGGGISGELAVARPLAERVRRIPVRAPLTLPNAGFPLFAPEYLRPVPVPLREPESEVSAVVAAPAAEPRAGMVQKRTETVYYEVEGVSQADLAAALREHGPNLQGQRFFGMTKWEVSAGYRPVEGANGCAIDALTVQVEITTHLPRWDRSATAPKELSGAWDRFLHALDRHEYGHRALAEEAAEVIRHRLLSATAPACDRLDLVAQREMTTVMREYEAHNLAYDTETGHGRTQGAVWPAR